MGKNELGRIERAVALSTLVEMAELRRSRPKAHAWIEVIVEVQARMVKVADDAGPRVDFEADLVAVFINEKTGKEWREVLFRGMGEDLAGAVGDLLGQAEHALRCFDEHRQREGEGVFVPLPAGAWPGSGLLGKGARGIA